MPEKRCLLIMPRHFYSFEQLFTEELHRRGYVVTVANDEYPAGTVGKLMGKLRIPLIKSITDRELSKTFLDGQHYELALIFKGRGITESLIRKIRECADEVIGYNWDSFTFNNAPLQWMRGASGYYTFDYRDAETHAIPVVELFSSANLGDELAPVRKDIYVSAIFRNHSRRLAYLDRVLKVLGTENCRIFIYEQNLFFFLLNFLHSPWLYWKYRRYVSFQSLSYEDYTDLMRRSRYTIDYAHPDQSGLTMRSFEALSAGTKIITNNSYISHSNYFDNSNAVLFPESGSSESLKAQMQSSGSTQERGRFRTLRDFFDDLLGSAATA